MYESPIKIIYGQMQTQIEGDILKAVMSTDIQVDKEELTRALRYDRDQYERGFADGYMKAKQEVAHGRWILTAHEEHVNCQWNVTAECSTCHYDKGKIYAGFFTGFPKGIAREIVRDCACSVKLDNYCPNCGAKMDQEAGHD